MRCEQIMKKNVECIQPTSRIEDAARKMRDANIGFLPVCDEQGKVLGTLTDRDIVVRAIAEANTQGARIDQVMTPEVVACKPGDDVQAAQQLMAQHHKSRIMCVDEQGKLQGVISLSDVAQHQTGSQAGDTLRQVSEREARA